MKKRLAALLLITALPASADFISGTELKKMLDAYSAVSKGQAKGRLEAGEALGYVSGVWDTNYYVTFCPGRGVQQSQAIAIVAKYLDEHPARWNEPAKMLLNEAFVAAYPCPGPQRKK